MSASRQAYYDRLARISASTVVAPVTIITARQGRALRILGSFGAHTDSGWELTNLPALARLSHPTGIIEYVPNIKSWRDVVRQPIVELAPFVRRVVSVPVPLKSADVLASIVIGQPGVRWPFDAKATTILRDLAALVGEEIENAFVDRPAAPAERIRSFAEITTSDYASDAVPDSSGDFLLATLKSRTSVRARGGVTFIALRSWAAPIKPYQIKALEIVKRNPRASFVRLVAAEMIARLDGLISPRTLTCVAPVPCGHSKGEDCLSVRLAREIAAMLELPVADVLTQPRRAGKSHPRKNKALVEPEFRADDRLGERLGTVLLVDDVATSGRHIELAAKRLLAYADHVTPVAWIGA